MSFAARPLGAPARASVFALMRGGRARPNIPGMPCCPAPTLPLPAHELRPREPDGAAQRLRHLLTQAESRGLHQRPWVYLQGGAFTMGSDADEGEPADGEGPARPVWLSPFRIAPCTVTNAEYARFVAATGHVSVAEELGYSHVFAGLLPHDFPPTRAVADAPWWRLVEGACWHQPEGPGSSLAGRLDHPVVQVSWHDARAYCAWAGGRLPTEAQWEFAARGGLAGARYPWGDALVPEGRHRCNIWQGDFPRRNTAEDGFAGTAPADAYAPNGFGLYNCCGNVWEWVADAFGAHHEIAPQIDPSGPPAASPDARRVLRGGSFLCHESWCNRYRVSARTSNEPLASTSHMGFRMAAAG